MSEIRKRQLRYGALAAAVLLLAAGLIILTHHTAGAPASSNAGRRPTNMSTASTSATAAPTGQSAVSASSDEPAVISARQRDEAVGLIADARRQASAGNFSEAEASLKKAEAAFPQMPEIEQARADIERLKTPEGNLAAQLARARLAIEHNDPATAEAALAEASRIKPDAPEIAEMRGELQAAREKAAQRETRIADALARMREAVARHDFAAADSALNEAERIDVQDPSVRRARGELARARGAQQNSQN
ncbi:MAG: hypothetical protein JSS04_19805 [Proteobacteria bacterium]|nr:hypothetical protein [Pseudomonadota bacterium]